MKARTLSNPIWLHFGAGNFFRALPAAMMQKLLDRNAVDRGIILVANRGSEVVDEIFRRYDCETTLVTLKSDGQRVVSHVRSIAEAYSLTRDFAQICVFMQNPCLQLLSFTVTEKVYNSAEYWVQIAKLLRCRYESCATPLALVSMDNCSHNGDKLRDAVLSVVADHDFRHYIQSCVSFPLTMVDKITPSPDPDTAETLGLPLYTSNERSFYAPFVNAEEAEYLVVQDNFPNGRPPLELAGAMFADRETVAKAEKMKVSSCLNPLHTSLAIFGRLFGYERFHAAIRDPLLLSLMRRLGYDEGLPVSPDPKIISPRAFLDEVINVRLPNTSMPDSPRRTLTDTSQKIPIRFGETIRSYGRNTSSLVAVPLTIAGWLRYLGGTDDSGSAIELSPDPLLPELLGKSAVEILSDTRIFPHDFIQTELCQRIVSYFHRMTKGVGAVRLTVTEALRDE